MNTTLGPTQEQIASMRTVVMKRVASHGARTAPVTSAMNAVERDPERRTRGSAPRRRWPLAVSGLAAAAVAGVVVVSTLTPSSPAFASWTPTPSSVTTQERAAAGAACTGAGQRPGAEVVLVERRGEWIGVAAVTPEPAVVTCLVHLPSGDTDPVQVLSGVSGGQGAIPSAGEFTEGAITEFRETSIFGIGATPAAAFNVGDVGTDVTALDIITADGELVHATVDGGRFIAWWPGSAFGKHTEGNGGPAPDLRYRITLADGTVTEDANPVLPR